MTENEKAIINSDSSFKEIRLVFPNHEIEDIENDRVYLDDMSIEESIFDGDTITFGDCNSSIFKIRVADFDEDVKGARMNVYVHYTNEELGEVDVTFGKYIVANIERTADRRWRDITATDYMTLFDVNIANWYNTTLFPSESTKRTVKQIRTMLCSLIGVTQQSVDLVNDTLQVGKSIEPQTLSARELLRCCCEVNGCFGHFNWSGVLEYIKLETDGLYPSTTLYPSSTLFPKRATSDGRENEMILTYKQDGCQYADYNVAKIDSVGIMKEDGDLSVHADITQNYTNRYNVIGNILLYGLSTSELEDVAENILTEIGSLTYTPNYTEIYGGIYMSLGQKYSVETTTYIGTEVIDKTFSAYLLKRTITGIQSMSQILEANGQEYQPETVGYDVENQYKILNGKSASYKRDLESLEIEYHDFAEETTSTISQHANEIVLSVDNSGNVVSVALTGDRETGETNFTVNADNISLEGKTFNLTSDDINIISDNFNVDSNGDVKMHVTSRYVDKILYNNVDVTDDYNIIGIYERPLEFPEPDETLYVDKSTCVLSGGAVYIVNQIVLNKYDVSSLSSNILYGSTDDVDSLYPPIAKYNGYNYVNQSNGNAYGLQAWGEPGEEPEYYTWEYLRQLSLTGEVPESSPGLSYVWRNETGRVAYIKDAELIINDINGIILSSKQFNIDESGNASFKGSLDINNRFIVDDEGNLNINNKLTIDKDGNFDINGKFSVDKDGNATAESLTVEDGLIEGSSIEGGTIQGSEITGVDMQTDTLQVKDSFEIYYHYTEEGFEEDRVAGTIYGHETAGDAEHSVLDIETEVLLLRSGALRAVFNCPVYAESYQNTSDKRIKENFEDISLDYENAYYELKPLIFNYIGKNEHELGLIAQDLEALLEKYKINKDNCFIKKIPDEKLGMKYTLDYTKFIPYNIHMIQKQHNEINNLKEELATLKEQVAFLMGKE